MRKIAIPLAATCLLLAACTKNSQPVEKLPQSFLSIKGSALLIDENDAFLTDYSGTTVTVENTSPQISVQGNARGVFELPASVNTLDTAVLRFEHAGYGTIKNYLTRESWADTSGLHIIMHPLSKVLVNALSAKIADGKLQMIFNVTVPPGNAKNYIAWIFRKNNPVIAADDAWGYRSVAVQPGDNSVKIYMCPEECGYFQKGDTIYLRGFGSVSPTFEGFAYGDKKNNKLILTCANTTGNSATVALAIP